MTALELVLLSRLASNLGVQPASASQMLRLKVFATTTWRIIFLTVALINYKNLVT